MDAVFVKMKYTTNFTFHFVTGDTGGPHGERCGIPGHRNE